MACIRRQLTYANVMATVAVFLALGGGAYAAIKLPKNSVKAKQFAKSVAAVPRSRTGRCAPSTSGPGSPQASAAHGGAGQPGPGAVSCTSTGDKLTRS